MKPELYDLSATDAIRAVRSGKASPREIAESCIERIKVIEPRLKAWAAFEPDLLLEQFDHLEARRRETGEFPQLAGALFGVKDIFNTETLNTEMGSELWSGFSPGNDARAVFMMRYAGACLAGKTVTAEFAVHHPGETLNPYGQTLSAGTSSGASAVAVATGMVPVSLGTQTAGSTIRPASYLGVYGMKPSFGLVPRTGVLKTADTLDHVSFFARTVCDLKLTLNATRVSGANHPFIHKCVDKRPRKSRDAAKRIAMVKGPKWSDAESYAQESLHTFANVLGGLPNIDCIEYDLPAAFSEIFDIHQIIYTKSLSYYFAHEIEQPDKISRSFREMTNAGRSITADEFRECLAAQTRLSQEMDSWLSKYDAVITLAAAGEAPEGRDAPDRPDNCLIWTFCGVPSVNLPIGFGPEKLPLGVQIIAPKYHDLDLLDLLAEFEDEGAVAPAAVVEPIFD